MKKIIIAGAIVLASATSSTTFAQSTQVVLNTEKKEIKQEEKELRSKEREYRKEDRAYEKTQVSFFMRNQFGADFPNAQDVYYHAGKYFDEADYTLDGTRYTAYYDTWSNLVGTTAEKQLTDLPASAQKEINKRYEDKGYSVDRVVLFDDNEANDTDMWMFGRQFDDEDVYFVEISKAGKKTVLAVDTAGVVSFFMNMSNGLQ